MTVILLLVIAEMALFTQFNAPLTVYYRNSDPLSLQKFLHSRPAGFPLPDQHTLIENSDKNVAYEELWVNTNTYAKTVSQDIFYPFVPAGLNILQADTALLQGTLNHTAFLPGRESASAKPQGKLFLRSRSRQGNGLCTRFGFHANRKHGMPEG